jgi:heme A synthase
MISGNDPMAAATMDGMESHRRFALFAWGVLGYNLLTVAWGAFVRATGSGAGCGSHWPLCNGVVVQRAPQTATLIELTHRVSSGLALLAVLTMLVWAWRAYPAGHRVRRGAALATGLIIVEALLGAGLVLFELVADNPSLYRAASMSAHLVNTFLLLGMLALTAWWASGGRDVRLRGQGTALWLVLGGVAGLLLVGASGAIAALGDTLFPARSLAEGLRQDTAPTAHLLLRLRVWHPILAVAVGAYLVVAGVALAELRPGRTARRLAMLLAALFILQLGAGLVNLLLLAPIWMQLVHLLLADAVWIALVLTGATVLAVEAPWTDAAASGSLPSVESKTLAGVGDGRKQT